MSSIKSASVRHAIIIRSDLPHNVKLAEVESVEDGADFIAHSQFTSPLGAIKGMARKPMRRDGNVSGMRLTRHERYVIRAGARAAGLTMTAAIALATRELTNDGALKAYKANRAKARLARKQA